MKRKIFIALVLAMSCLFSLNVSVFAEVSSVNDETLHIHNEDAIIADDYETLVSEDAIEKMEAYLDTLDSEARQLILEDEEMV